MCQGEEGGDRCMPHPAPAPPLLPAPITSQGPQLPLKKQGLATDPAPLTACSAPALLGGPPSGSG